MINCSENYESIGKNIIKYSFFIYISKKKYCIKKEALKSRPKMYEKDTPPLQLEQKRKLFKQNVQKTAPPSMGSHPINKFY